MNNSILEKTIKKFSQARILVIGDVIIDHFIWGSVSRISPEAPVPVVNVTHENLLLGGAANVLNNLYALGSIACLSGVIGTDPIGDKLLELLEKLPSPTEGIIRIPDRPTMKKTRIVAQGQQVVRFDREIPGEFTAKIIAKLIKFISENINNYQAIIISDYSKGMISQLFMDELRDIIPDNMPVIVDPKPNNPERFKGATIITPNNHEAEIISGIKISGPESLKKAASVLLDIFNSEAVLITRGESGMYLLDKNNNVYSIPTVAKEVFDVTGAGDTVIATLALGLSTGLSFVNSATLANTAAGIVVGKVGTATVSSEELCKRGLL
jgi:D-glycero-beta-D-manno-heptose-7-phosphate kinase